MGFARSSCWAKLALVSVLIGAILCIAGFATNSWIVFANADGSTKINLGLFMIEVCNISACTTTAVPEAYATDIFNAMRILETVGTIMAVFLVFFILVYTCMDNMRTKNIARIAMIICFVTGLLIFVGMCLCLAYVPFPYAVGFSLGLTVLGYLLVLIAGSLLIPDSCNDQDDDDYDDRRKDDYDDDYYDRGRRRRW